MRKIRGSSTKVAFVAILLLVSTPLLASSPGQLPADSPKDVARAAQQVVESHCARLTRNRASAKADALGAIGPVYSRVSVVYEQTRIPWLVYWRGVLSQCLGEDQVARVDLEAFVQANGDDRSLASQVVDAKRRLRLLDWRGRPEVRARSVVGLVAGAGLALAAVSTAVGSAQAASAQETTREQLYLGDQPRATIDSLVAQGEGQALRQSVLLGFTIGFGLGSGLSFVIAATRPRADSSETLRVLPGPVPLGMGLEVHW